MFYSARKRPIPYHRPSPSSSSSRSSRGSRGSCTPRSWTPSRSRSPSYVRRVTRRSPSPKKKYERSPLVLPTRTRSLTPQLDEHQQENDELVYNLESPPRLVKEWSPPTQSKEDYSTPTPEHEDITPVKEQLPAEDIDYYTIQQPVCSTQVKMLQPVLPHVKEKINVIPRTPIRAPPPHHLHPSLTLLHHARPGLSIVHESILLHDPYHPLLRTPLQRPMPGSYYSPYLGAPYC